MPNCFQLTRKGENEPSELQTVDKLMCEHFGFLESPKDYMMYWYHRIGLPLACGKTFDDIRTVLRNTAKKVPPELTLAERIEKRNEIAILIAICDWLDANYTVYAFYSRY